MIDNRETYQQYIRQDQRALGRQQDARPRFFGDEIWKFEILLRKVEFDINCRHGAAGKLIGKWHKNMVSSSERAPRVYDSAECVRAGAFDSALWDDRGARKRARRKNCRLQEGVTIGATNGSHEAAVIGDNCYFGSGAKVIGAVRIADDVAVGANAW